MLQKGIASSVSVFDEIIQNNILYVDKTKYLYNLVSSKDKYYFLSRPRRFGKSLTVSTFEAIFKGKKELFKNLYIGKTDYGFKEYPVIRLDFSKCQKNTPEKIAKWLNDRLIEIGLTYNIQLDKTNDYDDNFTELIQALSKIGKVVILIDEYDNRLTANYGNKNIQEIREIFRGFFAVIKASTDYVRFVFLTGVTKYSSVGVFSAMNNLKDISLSEKYATMLGFTQKELEENFKEYIDVGMKAEGVSRTEYLEKVKRKYDGYRFVPESETLYNPVSVSSFFDDGGTGFRNYWAEMGGMKMISDIARKVKFDLDEDLKEPIGMGDISTYDIVDMTTTHANKLTYKALLLQTGYLTISRSEKMFDDFLLYLDYPNREIKEYFSLMLANNVYNGGEGSATASTLKLVSPLVEGDVPLFVKRLEAIYASVPYTLYNGKKNTEADFHKMFHGMMQAVEVKVDSEKLSDRGRIDSVVEVMGHTYIFEFKLDKSADEALAQIKDKNYYEQYIDHSKKTIIHLIGINFSSKKRNITEYKECIIT